MATAATAGTPGILSRVSSYVEWAPIIAGAVAAAAVSFVLFAFGTAIGLTAVSPWSGSSLPAWLIAVIASLWVLVVQAVSYALGGYIAGRLRAPMDDVLPAERHFRDGTHGFLVWAVGVVISALILGWAAGAVLKGGTDITAGIASAATQASGSAAGALTATDPLNYSIDRLFRSGSGAPTATPAGGNAPAAASPATATTSQVQEADRSEVRRVLVAALSADTLPPDDRTFLASRASAIAGIPQPDAEKRVDDAFAALQKAKAQAKDAADKARRASAIGGFLTAAAALIAAAAAATGAGLGGRHRDENGTLRIFGRERFW